MLNLFFVLLALYWTGCHGSPCWFPFEVAHGEPQEVIICSLSSQLWEYRLTLKQPPSLELICQDLYCPSLSRRSQTQVNAPSKGIHIKFFQFILLKPFLLATEEREAPLYLSSLMETGLNSTNLFKEIPLEVLPYLIFSNLALYTLTVDEGFQICITVFWSYFWNFTIWSRISL